MRVPSAELAPVMSMHLPIVRSVPAEPAVHCWLAAPEQVHTTIGLPLAVLAPESSTHKPCTPVIGPLAAAWSSPICTPPRWLAAVAGVPETCAKVTPDTGAA